MKPILKPLSFVEYVKGHIYTKFYGPIVSLFGISDAFHSFVVSGKIPYLLLGALGALCGVLVVNFWWLRATSLLSKQDVRHFYPFHSTLTPKERKKLRIARPAQIADLAVAIRSNVDRHTVVSGNSGAGKSTIIDLYLGESEEGYQKEIANQTIGSLLDVLHFVLKTKEASRKLEFQTLLDGIVGIASKDVLDRAALARLIEACLELAHTLHYQNKTVVFIFDQAERLVPNIAELGENKSAAIYEFFNALRNTPWARTVFVCRSDQISSLLQQIPRTSYDLLFIPSMGEDGSDTATEEIRQRFINVCKTEERARKLEAIASRNGVANTFVLSLAGYIVESTSASKILESKAPTGSDGAGDIMEVYIKLLRDEYAFLQKDYEASADIEILLFGLALYNHRTNLPCSIDMIAGLTHLPMLQAQIAADYLVSRGVIEQDGRRDDLFRVAHDLLADHLMRRENSYLRMDHAHAMQQIMDRKRRAEQLFDVQPETNPFYTLVFDARASFAAMLLWAAAGLYFWRIAFPESVYHVLRPVNEMLDSFVPGIVTSSSWEWWFFIPTALTQYIWVIFMYGLDEGFFRYVTRREKRPWMRVIIHISGPLGAALGFVLSFAPSLFIIPIVIPGLILALAYLILWFSRPKQKLVDKYFLELGLTTLMNMAIALTVCWGLSEIIVRRSPDWYVANVVSLILVCGLFCYFAYAMRERQGSLRGRISMLAVYDAGS